MFVVAHLRRCESNILLLVIPRSEYLILYLTSGKVHSGGGEKNLVCIPMRLPLSSNYYDSRIRKTILKTKQAKKCRPYSSGNLAGERGFLGLGIKGKKNIKKLNA